MVTQIYAYLSLAELGFGAATNIKLFKYFGEKNEKKIAEVFNESKKLYFKSGLFIFISGIFISFVLPFFIKDNNISSYYIIGIMLLYSIDFLTDYLYGLPYRNLLIVDENLYIINIVKTSQQIVFKIIELILIINHVNLILIIALGAIANLLSSYFLIRITKKKYSFLEKYKGRDRTVAKPAKDIVINNISEIVNEKTDSIIVANQLGLTDTSIYSMYNLIMNYLHMFILNFLMGIKSSVGSIISDTKQNNNISKKIFSEFLLSMNFVTTICTIVLAVSIVPFIKIFIDNSYGLSWSAAVLFASILWLNVMQKSLFVVIEVKGKFEKIKYYSLVQAILNIVLSILLISIWGITGILFATVITTLLITLPAKAKIAFKEIDLSLKYFVKILVITIFVSGISIFFINHINIYVNITNLLDWFLMTGIIFIIISIIIFIIFYIFFNEFKEIVRRFMKMNIVFKIKRFILYNFSKIKYHLFIKNKQIKVHSILKTIDDIIKNKASIVRYGDGEMDIIKGKNLKFQKYNKELSMRLADILSTKQEKNFYIALPEIYNGVNQYEKDEKVFWTISLHQTYKSWYKYCRGEYYNAFLSRPYLRYKNKNKSDEIFQKLKEIYKNKKIIIVEGEYSRLGVGNDLFDGSKELKRILCPTQNAFEVYDKILSTIKKQSKDYLIIVSLGPTSKLLVYDLYKIGYQAIDLGHIDLEYEWYLRKETQKVIIENKYVNESDVEQELGEINDKKYNEQIITKIKRRG